MRKITKPMLCGAMSMMFTAMFPMQSLGSSLPANDIFVAELTKNKSGFYQAGDFKQITTHKGYDNQPNFLPNGKGLLYTSMRIKADGQYQSDSFEYDFASGKHTNLTKSITSEYSPTLMNNGRYFSTIVERENEQQFWAQPYKNSAKAYRINMAEPVGYHAWGKNGDLVMFVLGKKEGEPHTLQYQKNMKVQAKVVAKDLGRSLRYTASRNAFSFTQLLEDKQWWLSEYLPSSNKVVRLVPMPKNADYYTWLDSETAITAVDGVIHQWKYQKSGGDSVALWMPWLDVKATCSTKVTRLAVDNKQSRLAFVCDEKR